MRHLLILRGISGAGKSTFVKKVQTRFPSLVHASADFVHLDGAGVYRFDPSKLSEGHNHCFRTAVEAMQRLENMVVVDNTNTQTWEMAPYILAGQAYGYKIHLIRLTVAVDVAAKRNVHGVPFHSICKMAERFQPPLPFWPPSTSFQDPTQEQVNLFLDNL